MPRLTAMALVLVVMACSSQASSPTHRGNIVTGTLRDASGRALADTDFGASPSDAQVSCLSCNARTDAAGHFALTLPSASIRFQTWDQPNQPALVSTEYPVNRDMTLDPVLKAP